MSQQRLLEYPILKVPLGEFPLLDDLAREGHFFAGRTQLDLTRNMRHEDYVMTVFGDAVHELLNRARESGKLEPLASLAYFILPQNTNTLAAMAIKDKLLPYQQDAMDRMVKLAQNIALEVQVTPDNVWGNAVLNNGILIFKSGGKFFAYRYAVKGETKKSVTFQRLPDSGSVDLETAITAYHNPQLIESPILVKSQKPYHVKEDILPFFAYRLIGLR